MSRSIQDQFIDDDEEEVCPLCVEEFDLTDKGFRPCPCGYQICQFCYHNVKTNMNGLCPACRRPYNDDDIQYKVITPEETAAHKARQAQKQKKTQQALQKEKQKAEADHLSRKHLAGMRVVQKNLVYVTGLSPSSQEEELLETLRGDQFFGQYGKIIKIVVSKAKDNLNPHSVGVYVTYERKEDAQTCINAVDGAKNADRTLRAQFGTTKYCSAYLRGDTCTNRNCMFLHEPGEANESYSRADLSSMNANSSQHGHGRAPPPQSQQPMASASQAMARQGSSDRIGSPAPSRPALPSTASWASKPAQSSRAESRSTSTTLESPAPTSATPAQPQAEQEPPTEAPQPAELEESATPSETQAVPARPRKTPLSPLVAMVKNFKAEDFKLFWSQSCLPPSDSDIINSYPPLFDNNGSARIRLRRQREEEQRRLEQEAQVQVQALQQPLPVEPEGDNPEMSGSLQLGGEPEEPQSVNPAQSAIHPPGGHNGGLDQQFQFGSSPGLSDRGMTPQQHQQMLLQTFKPNAQGAYPNQPANFQQSFSQQTSQPLGHQRNVSRYSFANESTASAAVKPVANPKLLNQQSSMMPPAGGNQFGAQHQQPHGQFYTSNVQGPPPGLKTTGTPPVSGNLTFGQGHGFATGGLQYGAGTSRNQQDSYYRDLLRGRETGGGVDAKRELHSFPNYNNAHPNAAYQASQSNAFAAPPYASLGAYGDDQRQRKKKGKKHRHANTSSSSGGGVVDVSADPSTNHILQARLHQGGGLGGGAFTGQPGAPNGLYSVMHGGYNGRW
ncbi:general negative regulator of transcription [Lecanosticta acicola]|uniref:General negative regulator of transcription n=1 Tax=Lecanosticta acicola TaxID=111012 RepID=A0AAI8YUJ2_9PEZI|nr:general negative regulator of transcription [Lecanosticta acicola]